MNDIQIKAIKLKAKNSSGKQELFFDYHHESGDVTATLVGEYEGDKIQIDFNEISKKNIKKIIKRLNRMLEFKK